MKWIRMLGARSESWGPNTIHLNTTMKTRYPKRQSMNTSSGINTRNILLTSPECLRKNTIKMARKKSTEQIIDMKQINVNKNDSYVTGLTCSWRKTSRLQKSYGWLRWWLTSSSYRSWGRWGGYWQGSRSKDQETRYSQIQASERARHKGDLLKGLVTGSMPKGYGPWNTPVMFGSKVRYWLLLKVSSLNQSRIKKDTSECECRMRSNRQA